MREIIEIDLSLNRSLEELESSYWEFIEVTEGEDSSMWSKSTQEDFSALEGYLMRQDRL
jgi:pyruvate/2-oxoacid:ferredoxin oxidoreductase beta subunit|tara:strand:+ start:241 stop:417 length:177 start_codon:yes stop_codon:yes gene_type:complete